MTPEQGPSPGLVDFLAAHRDEILRRTGIRVGARLGPGVTSEQLEEGVPLFLDHLEVVLGVGEVSPGDDPARRNAGAAAHGAALQRSGFTIAHAVHGYGDVCQVVTELAEDLGHPITVSEFHAFNWCVDLAVAEAVTEYQRRREAAFASDENERLGMLAHELRNSINAARLSYELLRLGRVGVRGSTSNSLGRNLRRLGVLIDRSLAEVRLQAGTCRLSPIQVAALVEDVEVDARAHAADQGLGLAVAFVDPALVVLADGVLFGTALSNLVQNAVKFSHRGGCVSILTSADAERVRIHVADDCGGLGEGVAEHIFQPFEQWGADRTGLGLGLTIARRAAEAQGGSVSVEDRPGAGCTFTLELPRAFTAVRGQGTESAPEMASNAAAPRARPPRTDQNSP